MTALVTCRLVNFDGEARGLPTADMTPTLDVVLITIQKDGFVARVGFDLSVLHAEELLCGVAATYELRYSGRAPATKLERKRFAVERVLPDAWASWRSLAPRHLTELGFPAYSIRGQPSRSTVALAKQRYEE